MNRPFPSRATASSPSRFTRDSAEIRVDRSPRAPFKRLPICATLRARLTAMELTPASLLGRARGAAFDLGVSKEGVLWAANVRMFQLIFPRDAALLFGRVEGFEFEELRGTRPVSH
jgi:hypothetical protein